MFNFLAIMLTLVFLPSMSMKIVTFEESEEVINQELKKFYDESPLNSEQISIEKKRAEEAQEMAIDLNTIPIDNQIRYRILNLKNFSKEDKRVEEKNLLEFINKRLITQKIEKLEQLTIDLKVNFDQNPLLKSILKRNPNIMKSPCLNTFLEEELQKLEIKQEVEKAPEEVKKEVLQEMSFIASKQRKDAKITGSRENSCVDLKKKSDNKSPIELSASIIKNATAPSENSIFGPSAPTYSQIFENK